MSDLALMTAVDTGPAESLPALIDRASQALADAKTHAEVLEARDMARVAYDAATSAARMARAKQAHDTVIHQVYVVKADALLIETRAKIRLAEEYDAAQTRGEVAGHGGGRNFKVADSNVETTAADLKLRRDEIHEARRLRDAENAEPGLAERKLTGMVERGQEPTKAALRREMQGERPQPPKPRMSQKPLWVWGRIKDFHRDGYMEAGASALLAEMTPEMRADIADLAPAVAAFIQEIAELSK